MAVKFWEREEGGNYQILRRFLTWHPPDDVKKAIGFFVRIVCQGEDHWRLYAIVSMNCCLYIALNAVDAEKWAGIKSASTS